MGIFNLFRKNKSKQENEDYIFYRANLFQKNIATQMEKESIELVNSFHHSLVSISKELFKIKTLNGDTYDFPIRFKEKDFSTITYIG